VSVPVAGYRVAGSLFVVCVLNEASYKDLEIYVEVQASST